MPSSKRLMYIHILPQLQYIKGEKEATKKSRIGRNERKRV